MAEKMQLQCGQLKHLLQNLAAAILAAAEALLPVENTERRLVRDKHQSVSWNGGIVHIARAVEPHSVNGYAAVLQKVDVGWQVFDIIGIVKAQIVVADNENLVLVGQLNEPIEIFQTLVVRSEMGEIAAVDNHYLCQQKLNAGWVFGDSRYDQLCSLYDEAQGVMDTKQLSDAVFSVAQLPWGENIVGGTQWTAIMNLTKPSVTYYMRRNFDKPFSFELERGGR